MRKGSRAIRVRDKKTETTCSHSLSYIFVTSRWSPNKISSGHTNWLKFVLLETSIQLIFENDQSCKVFLFTIYHKGYKGSRRKLSSDTGITYGIIRVPT